MPKAHENGRYGFASPPSRPDEEDWEWCGKPTYWSNNPDGSQRRRAGGYKRFLFFGHRTVT